VIWIGDAVDNTKAYLEGGEDYGSALMVVDYEGNVIASLYLMPVKGTVYLAISDKGVWRNGNPINVRQPVAIIRWPRDKNVVPQEIEVIYREIKKEFSEDGYHVKLTRVEQPEASLLGVSFFECTKSVGKGIIWLVSQKVL